MLKVEASVNPMGAWAAAGNAPKASVAAAAATRQNRLI